MNRLYKITASILLIAGISFTAVPQTVQSDFEISKNIDVFVTLYKQLHLNYVDDLNSGQLMKTAIDAMLNTLDPYTVYIPESEIEDYRFNITGQYGGIGAGIQARGKWVYITDPYEGWPAHQAGLQAGDKILEVNKQSAKDKTVEQISAILKGQPGTEVTVLIERDSTQKPIEKTIVRQEIKIKNVPYYGLIGEDIGFISLAEFKQNAGKEVKDAFIKLRDSVPLKGLILDLRGNGGGLLNEAVNIVNIFVDRGQQVVSTRGKLTDKNNYHKTLQAPVDKDIPLIVLVNRTSASASEIVAGALQDFDRAIVIGRKTYGKGLVQNIVPLSYNSQLKVTIAKYYIPSGRCIQEIDYEKKDENGQASGIPDSMATAFKTNNGRTVYDKGGIEPDISLKPIEYANITQSLLEKQLIFDYATWFSRKTTSILPPEEFQITDEIYQDFIAFLENKVYDYQTQSEKTLEALKLHAEKEKYFDAIAKEYEELKNKMNHDKQDDLIKFQAEIKRLLKSNIVSRYYYQKGRYIASLPDDPAVEKAMQLLKDQNSYTGILKGTVMPEKFSE